MTNALAKSTAIVVLLLVSSACSGEVSVGNDSMDRAEFEKTVTDGVTPDDPDADVSATCEGGIEEKDGATQDCVVKVGPDSSYVHVTLQEAGDAFDVNYQPYAPADVIEENAISVFGQQDITLDTVTCPGDLDGVEGETMECDVTSGDQSSATSVEVSSVEGLRVNLSYQLLQ